MKVCKDDEGYFILDSANQKVNIYFNGDVVPKVPSLKDLTLSRWHSNEKGNIITSQFDTLIDGDRSFKSLQYTIKSTINNERLCKNK